jgi:hypothetical protein
VVAKLGELARLLRQRPLRSSIGLVQPKKRRFVGTRYRSPLSAIVIFLLTLGNSATGTEGPHSRVDPGYLLRGLPYVRQPQARRTAKSAIRSLRRVGPRRRRWRRTERQCSAATISTRLVARTTRESHAYGELPPIFLMIDWISAAASFQAREISWPLEPTSFSIQLPTILLSISR